MASTDRNAIVTLARQISRKVSTNEVSDADFVEAINTFVLYDFPELLRLVSYRQAFSFYTTPNVGEYSTITQNTNDPMYNFKNVIISSSDPVYIAGYSVKMTKNRGEFFNSWPQLQQRVQIDTGAGAANFTGTLTAIPVTARAVLFSSIDDVGVGEQLIDVPRVSVLAGREGTERNRGNLYDPRGVVPTAPTSIVIGNNINYVTGAYDITFSNAPDTGQAIYAQTIPYVASRPTSMLFFNNTFKLRPIPDGSYEVKIESYVRPTELDLGSQDPDLEQYWQFIAYGGAIKILQRQADFDTIAQLQPEFERQMLMVGRKTLVEMDNERARTIFNRQTSLSASPSRWWWNY